MKQIDCWLDFISPYAYLAFEKLPEALQGLSYSVDYRPVLLGALLKHHGQLGPAEIPGKREWTYRQVLWQAHTLGVPMRMPAAHPFNPLALLRLALACGDDAGRINRHVAETVLRHVWRPDAAPGTEGAAGAAGAADAVDPARLQALAADLSPRRDPASPGVKDQLKANTDAAIAAGVFGVPAFSVDGRLFWGFDALPMLRACLAGDAWFSGAGWDAAAALPGTQRPR